MTVQNQDIRYRIIVEDIDAYSLRMPVTVTSTFTAGSVVYGVSSGASAVVTETAGALAPYLDIKFKEGIFFAGEELTGSTGGSGTKTGDIYTTSTPYTNSEYGLVDGTWTMNSDDSTLTDIQDAVKAGQFSKGGNLGNLSTFGFSVKNKDLAKDIATDGVYFSRKPAKLYIGIGEGVNLTFYSFWSGIIEDITVTKEINVEFKCVDKIKTTTVEVGSSELPITNNRNYNCALPVAKNGREETSIVSKRPNDSYDVYETIITAINDDLKFIDLLVFPSGGYGDALTNEFYGGYLDVVMGEGSGSSFKINSVLNLENGNYRFFVDKSVSGLKITENDDLVDVSLIIARYKKATYSLSQNPVKTIHGDNPNSLVEKALTVYDGDKEYRLSKDNDYIDLLDGQTQQIKLSNITAEDNIQNTSTSELGVSRVNTGIVLMQPPEYKIQTLSTIQDYDMKIASDKMEDGFDLFVDGGRFTMIEFLNSNYTGTQPVDFTAEVYFNMVNLYSKDVLDKAYANLVGDYDEITIPFSFDRGNLSIEGHSLVFDFGLDFHEYIDKYRLSNYRFNGGFQNTQIRLEFRIIPLGSSHAYTQTPDSYVHVDANYRYTKSLSVNDISIGCNGENVFGKSVDIDTVGNTIIYLLKTYYGVAESEIDLASFAQADADFELFGLTSIRNPAHQIVDQINGIQLLKDLLTAHHLGLFIDRTGKYQLENWLPKSTLFGASSTDVSFDENTYRYLSPIVRDDLHGVITDYELEWDLNEATGDYNGLIRIKNTNEDTFDFARDTEGVDESDSALAQSAWESLKAGYSRTNQLSQTKSTTKWIKASNADGTGSSEAILFIRNLSALINRPAEFCRIGVPINVTNITQELLTFIGITDQKITDGLTRNGWVSEVRLNIKKASIEYKVLLDINPLDVFIYRINVWNDGDNPSNEKVDGNFPENTKINGTGVVV